MLSIRLLQTGKRHRRSFRVVVAEARSKRDGKTVAQLGWWLPKENKLSVNKDAYKNWLERGARPTAAVRQLVTASGNGV